MEPKSLTRVHLCTEKDDGLTLDICETSTVHQVKRLVKKYLRIEIQLQQLNYAGEKLDDSMTLRDCFEMKKSERWSVFQYFYFLFWPTSEDNQTKELTIKVELDETVEWSWIFAKHAHLFDPGYDLDYRTATDNTTLTRGGKRYIRPVGCYLKALAVREGNEDNLWVNETWAVAYHGTTEENMDGILSSGQLLERFSKRRSFGPGIYCSPDPETALHYATNYHFKGRKYKMILQLRVDPAKIKVIPMLKHRHTSNSGFWRLDDYWVVPQDHVRICAVCVYPRSWYQ